MPVLATSMRTSSFSSSGIGRCGQLARDSAHVLDLDVLDAVEDEAGVVGLEVAHGGVGQKEQKEGKESGEDHAVGMCRIYCLVGG
jgi:hypothetical protein